MWPPFRAVSFRAYRCRPSHFSSVCRLHHCWQCHQHQCQLDINITFALSKFASMWCKLTNRGVRVCRPTADLCEQTTNSTIRQANAKWDFTRYFACALGPLEVLSLWWLPHFLLVNPCMLRLAVKVSCQQLSTLLTFSGAAHQFPISAK